MGSNRTDPLGDPRTGAEAVVPRAKSPPISTALQAGRVLFPGCRPEDMLAVHLQDKTRATPTLSLHAGSHASGNLRASRPSFQQTPSGEAIFYSVHRVLLGAKHHSLLLALREPEE